MGGMGIDLTGLAVVRIGTALWLLADLLDRAMALNLLTSDDGAYARTVWLTDGSSAGAWTLHLMTGSPLLIGALMLIAGLAHGALLVGWRTRFAALASVGLLVSLGNRTPLAALPLDPLLALLTWWCAVLPAGARLSLDAARRGPGGPPNPNGGILALSCLASLIASAWLLASFVPLLPALAMVIPHRWWRRIPSAWRRPPVTIWIDGECGICTRAGRLLTQIHGGDLTLRTIQEDAEVHALSDANTSWVVDAGGRRVLGWQGVRAMLWASPWLWPTAIPLPLLGEKMYRFVAHNRDKPWWGWLGPLPAEEPLPVMLRWLIPVALVGALSWEPAAHATGLMRRAAAGPALLTAPARLADGTQVDLRTAGGPLLIEPATVVPPAYAEFSSRRSQAHLGRLAEFPHAATAYCRYLERLAARRGQTVHSTELRRLILGPNGWRSTLITAHQPESRP